MIFNPPLRLSWAGVIRRKAPRQRRSWHIIAILISAVSILSHIYLKKGVDGKEFSAGLAKITN